MRPDCVPSARELALDPERWAVRMRCERGSTKQLPDLAVWLTHSSPPIALVAESGGRREDRQKWILEGWNGAIYAGQYSAVLYDCANDSVARWIHRLAKKARLARSEFNAVVPPRAEEIAALAPAADDEVPPESSADTESPSAREIPVEPARAPEPLAPVEVTRAPVPAAQRPETPEEVAERERRYRRSSASPRQSRAGDGDAELSTNALHDFCSPRWHRSLRPSGSWNLILPGSADVHASGRHPLADSLQPAEAGRQPGASPTSL